jgi:XRE family transcriptional regulator, fatty acid utilization regulator
VADRKIMVGQRVRRLRQERSLTQTQMAEQIGISTSYLNLIERNQRPVTVQFLLRLGQAYDIDLVQFAGDDEGRVAAQLKEVFSDPLFVRAAISPQDIEDVSGASPAAGEAVFTLYKAYRDLADAARQGGAVAEGTTGAVAEGNANSPAEPVLDYLQGRDNYVPELEELTDALWTEEDLSSDALFNDLRRVLEAHHGVKTRVLPVDVMEETLRRYDRHGRRVLLSEALSPEERTYQLAHQFALLHWADGIDEAVQGAGVTANNERRLLRIALADYAASAVLMPYGPFQQAARDSRYDIALLGRRFGAPVEQVCLRLATLQRPGAKGIPLFVVQLDAAGNVVRRFSGNGFHVPRFGGLCPRWDAYGSAASGDGSVARVVRTPDGTTFFTLALRRVRPGGGQAALAPAIATVIGCEAGQARQMVAADGLVLDTEPAITPIGPSCRLCERVDCGHRAQPPLNRRLIIDENYLGYAPYFFT